MPFDANGNYILNRPTVDYAKLLIAPKGRGERNYLEVKYRLQLLREVFPEAQVTTECQLLDAENNFACFRARVQLPNGAVGEGTGSETSGDFRDYIEKAETKAIGRALSAAGIGWQYGIADMEYESESPKDYVGVDSGIIQGPPTSKLTELKAEANRLKTKVTAEAMLEYSTTTFKKTSMGELNESELEQLIAWAKEVIATR